MPSGYSPKTKNFLFDTLSLSSQSKKSQGQPILKPQTNYSVHKDSNKIEFKGNDEPENPLNFNEIKNMYQNNDDVSVPSLEDEIKMDLDDIVNCPTESETLVKNNFLEKKDMKNIYARKFLKKVLEAVEGGGRFNPTFREEVLQEGEEKKFVYTIDGFSYHMIDDNPGFKHYVKNCITKIRLRNRGPGRKNFMQMKKWSNSNNNNNQNWRGSNNNTQWPRNAKKKFLNKTNNRFLF